jgi:endonuclease/exonuclease/phosphatase (EEP) superfamily protein YafD
MLVEISLFLLLLISGLSYLPFQHWIFRSLDFAKIQITLVQSIALLVLLIQYSALNISSKYFGLVLLFLWLHNIIILLPYTTFYPVESKALNTSKKPVRVLSVNVFQYNKKKHLLIQLINTLKPDILLTMESDKAWEETLNKTERLFNSLKKIPQDNTYGMHFYTTLETEYIDVNYFVAKDIPSIEARLKTKSGEEFMFFGVHPPPPSPVEEETSKERDADILALSRKIKQLNLPSIVVGDFNNVAWSKSSKLFKKNTQLLDPRIGRGFVSTFHAGYMFFRFPIDLVFHSKEVYIQELRTEKHINSDHFPVYAEFVIMPDKAKQNCTSDDVNSDEKKEIKELINEGKAVESDNRD